MKRNMDIVELENKVAIITGGYEKLGYDMACMLAEADCNIIITSRKIDKANETAEKIRKEYGVDTLGIQMDQCYFDQVKEMAEKAQSWKGHIDILINNAGGGSSLSEGDFLKRDPEAIYSMINTNLIGSMFCCKEVGRVMAQQGYGKIINLGSIAGMVGRNRDVYHRTKLMEQPVDYAAAKAGVIGMTRDLAAYMAPYGVNVNCISPGGFNNGKIPEEFVREFSNLTAIGRMGKMQSNDIKGAALFLASKASDYVTGHNLVVDGGFHFWK